MKMQTRNDETGLDSVAPESLRDASHFRRIIEAKNGLEAADRELRDAVAAARAAGDSWTVIGAAMGTASRLPSSASPRTPRTPGDSRVRVERGLHTPATGR